MGKETLQRSHRAATQRNQVIFVASLKTHGNYIICSCWCQWRLAQQRLDQESAQLPARSHLNLLSYLSQQFVGESAPVETGIVLPVMPVLVDHAQIRV